MAHIHKKNRKRHLFDVYFQILDAAKEGILKTPLMSEAKIPWRKVSDYLIILKKLGLIEEFDGFYRNRVFYATTDEGLEFMKRFKSFRKIIQ